ncbi:MAG: hypothetical protein AAGA08_00645 [Pseudomonadota bacterium]
MLDAFRLLIFVVGGLGGFLAGNLLAFFAKPLNLGLGLNSLIGVVVGGSVAVAQSTTSAGPALSLVISTAAVLIVMLIVGSYLNHRAR